MALLIPSMEHLLVLIHDFLVFFLLLGLSLLLGLDEVRVFLHHFYVRFALLLTRLALFVFFFLVEITDDLPESLVFGHLVRSLILTSHEVLLHVQRSQLLLIDQFFVLLPFFHLDIPILHSPHLKHFSVLFQLCFAWRPLGYPAQLNLLQHFLPELSLLFELVSPPFLVFEGLLLGVEFDQFRPLVDAAAGVEEVVHGVEWVHWFVLHGLSFVTDGVVSDRVVEFPPGHLHLVVGEGTG